MERATVYDDGLEESSLYDEDEEERAEFLAPSPVEPLFPEIDRQPDSPDAEAWVAAIQPAARLQLLEKLMPEQVLAGAFRRQLIAASAGAAGRLSHPCSIEALTKALVFTHEQTSPGVSRALEIHAYLARALARPGADQHWTDRIRQIHPGFELDVFALPLVEGLTAFYTEIARARADQVGEPTVTAIEALGLAQILGLNRPFFLETRSYLDARDDAATRLLHHAAGAENQIQHLRGLWAALPSPSKNGSDPVLRRVAMLAVEWPGLSAPGAAESLGISKPAARQAIEKLSRAGFLQEMTRRETWRYWRA
jgi:hypothetical protein